MKNIYEKIWALDSRIDELQKQRKLTIQKLKHRVGTIDLLKHERVDIELKAIDLGLYNTTKELKVVVGV